MANYIPDLSGFGRGSGSRAESSVGQALQALMGMLAAKKSEERQLTRQTQLGGEQHSRELELEEARARREEAKDQRTEKRLFAMKEMDIGADWDRALIQMQMDLRTRYMGLAESQSAQQLEQYKMWSEDHVGEAPIVNSAADLYDTLLTSQQGIAEQQAIRDIAIGRGRDPDKLGIYVPEAPAPLPEPPPPPEPSYRPIPGAFATLGRGLIMAGGGEPEEVARVGLTEGLFGAPEPGYRRGALGIQVAPAPLTPTFPLAGLLGQTRGEPGTSRRATADIVEGLSLNLTRPEAPGLGRLLRNIGQIGRNITRTPLIDPGTLDVRLGINPPK